MPRASVRVRMKVYGTDLKASQIFDLNVPRVTAMQKRLCDHEVANFISLLKAQFPGNEFQVVPTGRNRYNVLPIPLAHA